jgi:endoglucanase
LKAPYDWENAEAVKAADKMVEWALADDLNVIIDLHHSEFDGTISGAATTERLTALWKNVAERYKNTNPERVFFELRNEPHDIKAEDWRAQAEQLIKTVRRIAPRHTLIVGFHDWNSRQALIDSKPFADTNIIYTFHYYDPFVFTHQGATWAGAGLAGLRGVSFPWTKETKIELPPDAKGKWVEKQAENYQFDSKAETMFDNLKAAKQWSQTNNVPIFLGEFGSYNKYNAPADRCRHAKVVYSALGKLEIPSAWWEWDGGFNMFEAGTARIMNCMRDAINSYSQAKAVK